MDLVEIGFKINSKEVATAVNRVDKLLDKSKQLASETVKAGKKVKQSNDEVGASTKKKLSAIEKEIEITKKAQALEKQGLSLAQARKVATHELTGATEHQVNTLISLYKEQSKITNAVSTYNKGLHNLTSSIKQIVVENNKLHEAALKEHSQIMRTTEALSKKTAKMKMMDSLIAQGISKTDANTIANARLSNALRSEVAEIERVIVSKTKLAKTRAKETTEVSRFQSAIMQAVNAQKEAAKATEKQAIAMQPLQAAHVRQKELHDAEVQSINKANLAVKEKIKVTSMMNTLMQEGLTKTQATEIATLRLSKADQNLVEKRRQQILALNQTKLAKASDVAASNIVEIASAKTSKQIEKEIRTLEYLQQGYSKTIATKLANAKISGVSATEVSKLGAAAKATESYTKAQNRLRISSSGTSDVISNVFLSFKLAIIMQGTIELIKMADAMELLRSRAALVSPTTQSVSETMGRLVETSMETRASLLDTVTLYNRLTPSLSRYGRTTEDVFKVIDTFNNSLLVSGATARETASAILQFSQSMAAGKLAGDEFRSVTEAAPELLNAIAKGSGYARDQLKDMSKNGLLTTKLVSEALIKTWKEMGEKAKEIPVNIGQALTNLKTSFSYFISLMNQSTGATGNLAKQINALAYDIKAFAENLRAGNYDEQINKITILASVITGAAVATKGYTVILGAYNAVTNLAIGSTKKFTKILRLNPFVAILSTIIGVVSAITLMSDATVDTGDKIVRVSSIVTSAFNVISGRITDILERNKEIIDLLLKHTNKLIERIKKTAVSVVKVFNSIVSIVFDFYKKAVNGIISVFVGGYTAAKTGMKRIIDLVVTGGSNIGIGLKTAIDMALSGDFSFDNFQKSFAKSMKKSVYGKDISTDIKDSFTSQFEKDWVGDLIVTPLKNAVDVVKGVGGIIKRDTLNLIDEILAGAEKLDKLKNEQMGKGGSPAVDAPVDEFKDKTEDLQRYLDKLIEVSNAEMAGYLTLEKGTASSLADAEARKLVNEQIAATTEFLKEQAEYDLNPFKELAEFDFGGLFGEIGNPFGEAIQGASDMIDVMQKNAQVMGTLVSRREELIDAGKDTVDIDATIAKASRKNVKDELKGTANIVGASKNMFKEKTVAYKLLANVERGYRMMELSMSIQSMAQKQAEMVNHVQTEGVKGQASATTSLASAMSGLPFPLNLAAFAATGAVLSSIGLFGGGSGGSSSSGNGLVERQEAQSTGGVLGQSDTKTDSIARSFERMNDYMSDTVKATSGTFREVSKLNNLVGNLGTALFKGLDFANGLISVKEYDGYSNKVGAGVASVGDNRAFQAVTSLGTSELPLIGGSIGSAIGDAFSSVAGSLFGKTKVRKVDEGIEVLSESFANIMSEGAVDAFAFADVKIKKKSMFKSSTKYRTLTEDLGTGINSAFADVLSGIYTSLESAVDSLGFGDMNKAIFEGLKISTKDMSDEDALAEIQAAFANVADTTVNQVLPSMEQFQRAGESLFDTLGRVVTHTSIFKDYLDGMGMDSLSGTVKEERTSNWFGRTNTYEVDVKVDLRDKKYAEQFAVLSDKLELAAGGAEEFSANLSGFMDATLTDTQKFDRLQSALSQGMRSFYQTLPATAEGLKDVQKRLLEAGNVDGFTWLTSNAEMLKDYYDQLEEYATTAYDFDTAFGLNDGLDPVKKALKGVGKDFEEVKKVAEETGKEGLGEMFKSLTDVQKNALEPFIDTLLDMVPVVEDLEKAVKSFQDVSLKIRDYLDKLKVNPDSGAPVDIAQEALKQYRELVKKAKGGDLGAAQALTGSADTLIKLSKDAYASGEIFQDIYSEIKSSLESVADVIDVESYEELQYNIQVDQLAQLKELNASMIALGKSLTVELTTTAKSNIEKLITYVTNTDKLPWDLKQIALSTASNLDKTVTMVANDEALTNKHKAIIFDNVGDLTKLTNFTVGSELSDNLKRIVLNEVGQLDKVTNLLIGSDLSEDTRSMVLNNVNDLIKKVNLTANSTLSEQDKSIIFNNVSDLVKLTRFSLEQDLSADDRNIVLNNIDDLIKKTEFEVESSLTKAQVALIFSSGSEFLKTIKFEIEAPSAPVVPEPVPVPTPVPVPVPPVVNKPHDAIDLGIVYDFDFSGLDFGFMNGGWSLSDVENMTFFAKGGAFTNTIVDTPTPFNMGVMGEAGPEAIMPLSRASNGELGVRVVSGGGSDMSPVVAEIQGSNKNLQALVRLQQASNQRILEKLDSIDVRLEGVEEKTRLQARM